MHRCIDVTAGLPGIFTKDGTDFKFYRVVALMVAPLSDPCILFRWCNSVWSDAEKREERSVRLCSLSSVPDDMTCGCPDVTSTCLLIPEPTTLLI